MRDWKLHGTITHGSTGNVYSVWNGGDAFKVTDGERPSPTEGGYGRLESAFELKGLRPEDFVPALGTGFGADPDAPRLEGVDGQLLTYLQARPLVQDSRFLCETVQDNDIERWRLSLGGQFVRETGASGGRFYVVPPDEARDMLEGMGLEDWAMDLLVEAGAFGPEPATPKA